MSQMSLLTAVTKPKNQPNTTGVDNRKKRGIYGQMENAAQSLGKTVTDALYPSRTLSPPATMELPFNPSNEYPPQKAPTIPYPGRPGGAVPPGVSRLDAPSPDQQISPDDRPLMYPRQGSGGSLPGNLPPSIATAASDSPTTPVPSAPMPPIQPVAPFTPRVASPDAGIAPAPTPRTPSPAVPSMTGMPTGGSALNAARAAVAAPAAVGGLTSALLGPQMNSLPPLRPGNLVSSIAPPQTPPTGMDIVNKPQVANTPAPAGPPIRSGINTNPMPAAGTPIQVTPKALVPATQGGQMITPTPPPVSRDTRRAQLLEGDVQEFNENRGRGMSADAARGSMIANDAVTGDLDPQTGEPGTIRRGRWAARQQANSLVDTALDRRQLMDPSAIRGNRTGIARINGQLADEQNMKDAAEKEAYLKKNANFYDNRYAEASQNPLPNIVPSRDEIKLAERLNAQGRNVSAQDIAQYNAQDRARREQQRQQASQLPGYNSQGQSPLVQRAMAERRAEREATQQRKEQVRDSRVASLAFQRNGLFPNTEFALQNAMNRDPQAGLAANAAMTTQQARDRMAQKEIDARTQISQNQLQQAATESNARLAQQSQLEADRNRQSSAELRLKEEVARREQGVSLVQTAQQLMLTDPVRGRQMMEQGMQMLSPLVTGQMPANPYAPGQVPPMLQAPAGQSQTAQTPQPTLSEAQDVAKSSLLNRNLQAFLPQVANLPPSGIAQGTMARLNDGIVPDEDALTSMADYIRARALADPSFARDLKRDNYGAKGYLDAIMNAPPGQKRNALMEYHKKLNEFTNQPVYDMGSA